MFNVQRSSLELLAQFLRFTLRYERTLRLHCLLLKIKVQLLKVYMSSAREILFARGEQQIPV